MCGLLYNTTTTAVFLFFALKAVDVDFWRWGKPLVDGRLKLGPPCAMESLMECCPLAVEVLLSLMMLRLTMAPLSVPRSAPPFGSGP